MKHFLPILFLTGLLFGENEEEKSKVAVLQFEGYGASDFELYLEVALFKTGKFSVIDRDVMNSIFKELQLDLSGLTISDYEKIGKLSSVQYLLSGTSEIVKMISVESGEIVDMVSIPEIWGNRTMVKQFSARYAAEMLAFHESSALDELKMILDEEETQEMEAQVQEFNLMIVGCFLIFGVFGILDLMGLMY